MPANTVLRPTLLALLLGAALHAQAQPAPAAARADTPYLSQEDAAARSARVSNVAYVLDFTLTGAKTFAATSRMDFDLKDTDAPLTVDLDKAKVLGVTVNGKAVDAAYNQNFLTLPAASLKRGRNSVEVRYEREHSTNGEGLHRYEDKADGRVYLYSHFEPAAAHQMFAGFDQPDLKATFQLNVTAPKDWTVISATPESKVEDRGESRRWTFPVSPKLSPYNFSLHAGPYKMWEDTSGKYPMRLFARQSVASQVHPQDWFKYTKNGLVYFDEYFGIPYPFKKYDQVLVPQFIYGAMENAAAVTFTETRFLSASPMPQERRQSLNSTILHEMAHQWFGDLVTMTWWNGLWLNESFASYMGQLGNAKSDEFPNAWLSFYRAKQGAYRTDDSITTHPIEVPVATTQNAFDNIDAITYTKGASVLHQLRKRIGDEAFQRGVHDYISRFSYANATLDDFIGALAKASGQDLSGFSKEWLYEPGLNTLGADYTCKDGKVASFALVQGLTIPAYDTLRTQLVQVALFSREGDALKLEDKQSVTYSGAHTEVPALVGKACPDLVYPNYEDWGFAKVVLDAKSFATARTQLAGVQDPMLRSMLWQSLSDGLSDRRLALDDFIQAVLANAPKEQDPALLRQALGYVTVGRGYVRAFAPGSAYEKRIAAQVEAMLWDGLQASRGQRDRALNWLDTWITNASTPAGLERLEGLLAGKVDAAGVDVDQETRWDIIRQLNRFDRPGSAALIDAELARDTSESGQLSALAARVSRPDAEAKAKYLQTVQSLDGSEPFSRLRVIMGNLYPGNQRALADATAEQRLQTLAAIDAKADPVFMRTYAGLMIPSNCTAASVARLQQAMDSMTTLRAGTRRSLVGEHEGDARCVAIREAFDASGVAKK